MSVINNEKEDDKATETATANSATGVQPSAFEVLRQTDQRVERLARENDRMEENIRKLSELEQRRILGGSTSGQGQEQKPAEINPVEYSKLVLAGKLPLK